MGKQIEVQFIGDEMAEAIENIDRAVKQLQNSGLKQSAIVLLLKDLLGNDVREDQIVRVLNGLGRLKNVYTTEKK